MSSTQIQEAYKYIIRLLTKRDYSLYKLKEKLREKDFEEDVVQAAIDEALSKNYIREELYTEARIKGLMRKNLSPYFIQQKLSQEDIQVSLCEIEKVFHEQSFSQEKQILQLIDKKFPSKTPELKESDKWYKLERKLINHLCSKGHSQSISKELISEKIRAAKHSLSIEE